MLGLSTNTIRAWESRYGVVIPGRSKTNRRLYSGAELEKLKLVLALVNSGHSIGAIAGLSERRLLQLSSESTEPGTLPTTPNVLAPIISALKRFDLAGMAELLESCRLSLSTCDYVLRVLSPLMGQVGTLVAMREISVAQEHALSAIVRDQIGETTRLLPKEKRGKKPSTFLFTTAEGDLHEFGILMAASLCASYSLPAYYLGPNLPWEALVLASKALRPTRIVLGNSTTDAQNPSFENYLRAIAVRLSPDVEVWIGGGGKIPHLRSAFGKRKYLVFRSLDAFDEKIRSKK